MDGITKSGLYQTVFVVVAKHTATFKLIGKHGTAGQYWLLLRAWDNRNSTQEAGV